MLVVFYVVSLHIQLSIMLYNIICCGHNSVACSSVNKCNTGCSEEFAISLIFLKLLKQMSDLMH